MLLVGIWKNGGLSDEPVEDMANSNLHMMRFLGLSLEDEVPDHSALCSGLLSLKTLLSGIVVFSLQKNLLTTLADV